MALSILNNIAGLAAQNQLTITNSNLQSTLYRLSSGKRINTGADDAAGLAIADGLKANITSLTQSVRNANDGIGMLQVADGALAQVTELLNRAVTLATEASTGTISTDQRTALDTEFTALKAEIDRIGTNTTFNGSSVFTASTTSIFLSDASSNSSIGVTVGELSATGLSLSAALTDSSTASTALGQINTAIATVASKRGTLGAGINRLDAASSVMSNQIQNLTSAEDGIRAADITEEVGNLAKYNILNQTGIAALAQANSRQQAVLALLQ